jgi:hypothetical protein
LRTKEKGGLKMPLKCIGCKWYYPNQNLCGLHNKKASDVAPECDEYKRRDEV